MKSVNPSFRPSKKKILIASLIMQVHINNISLHGYGKVSVTDSTL